MGVLLAGGQVDVVFGAAAGQRDVEQLAGQGGCTDDVAGELGGEALGEVDGGGVAEGDVFGDVIGGQGDALAGGQVGGDQRAVCAYPVDPIPVAVADEITAS
ncbi:hypothetical protein LAUMK41_05738 [Mycobacterium attenuatum]|nr:hypothetical protein LAUMK41_05738 [Mycobacterium attenuatum]